MTGLAPDPAVPRRDALLRPAQARAILSRRLRVPLARCEALHVKYRFGESLRVVYRCDAGIFAARTFPPGTSAERARRARALHIPEAGAALWVFPHDRKLTALARLADPPSLLDGCASARVVAYAAERSATAQCRDARGHVLGYAKVGGRDEARLTVRAHAALGDHPLLRVPRVLAADRDVLVLEPLAGRRLDSLGPAALERLGAALAALHGLPPAAARFDRLDLPRLATAAGVVARARPDVAGRAARLLDRLEAGVEDARRPAVCLHGDANLRNAILLDDGRVGLIDLEHVSAGPAAADLGQLLAGLLIRADRRAASAALLAGYARVARPPDRAALRWHTAACVLARVALPAVGRARPATLAHLPELLDAAAGLVAPRGGPGARAGGALAAASAGAPLARPAEVAP